VTVRLFPGARHEVFNETNRDEVTYHVIDWLARHTPSTAPTSAASPL
jgi:alpha-beta hydrolase superfamily lysophospholipase